MTSRINRLISRQAGRPSGLLGHLIGRIMVKDTSAPNEAGLAVLAAQPAETIVEIGFGQGRTVGRLAEAGARVVGVEVSSTMRSQAAAMHRGLIADGTVELHVGDGVLLPVADSSADAVFSAHTIYFWPDPATTFTEICRVLRPGGRIVLVFRDGAVDPPDRLDPEVYTFHTVADVDALAAAAGLVDRVAQPAAVAEEHIVIWSARRGENDG